MRCKLVISPLAYLTLLPTMWTLINSSNLVLLADPQDQRPQGSNSNEVLQVALDHAVKVSSKAASKRLTVEFVARLVLVCNSVSSFNFLFSTIGIFEADLVASCAHSSTPTRSTAGHSS